MTFVRYYVWLVLQRSKVSPYNTHLKEDYLGHLFWTNSYVHISCYSIILYYSSNRLTTVYKINKNKVDNKDFENNKKQ